MRAYSFSLWVSGWCAAFALQALTDGKPAWIVVANLTLAILTFEIWRARKPTNQET